MRRIKADDIKPGMVLAMPINTMEGTMVLNAGSVLTESHIKRVQDIQTSFIYIKDDDEFVENENAKVIRASKVSEIRMLVDGVVVGKGAANEAKAKEMTLAIADQWLKNSLVLNNILDISRCNEYLLAHSVTVCVYSLLVAMHLGYDEMRLRDLGLGALLHDVGTVMVPHFIVNKPGALTQEELLEIKKHPEFGYHILQKNTYLNLTSVHCAYQHHERYDGSGYPRGLGGDKIHPFAQIIAVADVYAALTSSNTFRRAIPPFSAILLLLKSRGTYFQPEIANAFSASVMPYKMNSLVRLSNGYVAEIIDYRNYDMTRPVFRAIYDAQQNRIAKLMEMDLEKDPNLYVVDTWKQKIT